MNVDGTCVPALVAEAETEVGCVVMEMNGVELNGLSEAYGLDSGGLMDSRNVARGGESSKGMIFVSFCEESGGGFCGCAFVPPVLSFVRWYGFACCCCCAATCLLLLPDEAEALCLLFGINRVVAGRGFFG